MKREKEDYERVDFGQFEALIYRHSGMENDSKELIEEVKKRLEVTVEKL